MTKKDVLDLLKANKNERGVENWKRLASESGLKSFGIGLTVLRKLAKQVGKDHDLALKLWATDIYDAKVIALLIDEPKRMTREQIEAQVEDLSGGYLAHVFSSCGATLAKTSFGRDVAEEWMTSKDPVRRRCAYGLQYEYSKSKAKSAPDDRYFLTVVDRIDKEFADQDIDVQMAMGAAIMGIGMRSKPLHGPALKVARKICPIDFDPTGKCDPFDAVKHLTSDRVKEKLKLAG
ncbi:MAG: DNA alkylation repair protein [Pseudomonadota bacterium]